MPDVMVCLPLFGDYVFIQGGENTGKDKKDQKGGRNGPPGDGKTDFTNGGIGKNIAKDTGSNDHDGSRGKNGMQGAVICTENRSLAFR